MKKYAFGVDIGGTTVKIGLFTTDGRLLDKWEIPTVTDNNGEQILSDIAKAVNKKLAEMNISKDDVEGIGAGVPGPVTPDGTVQKCINLGWDVFNVEEKLTRLTNLKSKAGNDANVAALGEMWQGGGVGFDSIVMVTLGTGVGGGVIVDGRIVSGFHGAAGEIGHIPVCDNETEPCGCGKKGCLEQYASANGIVLLAKRYLASNPDTDTAMRKYTKLTSKDIFYEAVKGDTAALLMVKKVGILLGKALASVSCVMNPEAFVIGGGMSKAGTILTDAIKEEFTHYAFHASRDTKFTLAVLGNDAGIYGGVKLILS